MKSQIAQKLKTSTPINHKANSEQRKYGTKMLKFAKEKKNSKWMTSF